MSTLLDVSVVVPVAPWEIELASFFDDLKLLPLQTEIIFSGPEMPKGFQDSLRSILMPGRKLRWITAPLGRASQINLGIRAASGSYLWVLHCDSRFTNGILLSLEEALSQDPQGVLYFDLKFQKASGIGALMKLTEAGVWVRSHIFKLPFGDQAFCFSRRTFDLLGGFSETAPHGEDHLFVWSARLQHLPIRAIHHSITTSARKYAKQGWLKTTLRHGVLTWKQAGSELWRSWNRKSLDRKTAGR